MGPMIHPSPKLEKEISEEMEQNRKNPFDSSLYMPHHTLSRGLYAQFKLER